MPCSGSIDMLAQTFDVPVCFSAFLGNASNVHCSLPVCASTANTVPGGASLSAQSLPAQPMYSRSL
jgi:hypothetical protein